MTHPSPRADAQSRTVPPSRRRSAARRPAGIPAPAPSTRAPDAPPSTRADADGLLEAAALALMRKTIEMALTGDSRAMRLCHDRDAALRENRPIRFTLPEITTPADFPKATLAILQAVATDELTPREAAELSKPLAAHMQAVALADLAERVASLEQADDR
ncbi:hypothetical protein [Methylobacterium tarhaniae]|uniref:hypothetical protein n=1 Tax=Methylobacterium tarhaniae TaxID=1187852 RepID=UPI003CFC9861